MACWSGAATAAACVALVLAIYVGHFAERDSFPYHGRLDVTRQCRTEHRGSVSDGVVDNADNLFFEGWYYKIASASGDEVVAMIPGAILRSPQDAASCAGESFFMLVEEQGASGAPECHFATLAPAALGYDATERAVSLEGVGVFTKESVHVKIEQGVEGNAGFPAVEASIVLGDPVPWPGTPLMPSVMGWFHFFPMQCFHGIASMYSTILSGSITINGRTIDLTDGTVYAEKDWGTNFPSSYLWLQANHFHDENATTLFASVAVIPWYGMRFPGFIMGMLHDGEVYKFATYTGANINSISAWSQWTEDAATDAAAAHAARAKQLGLLGFAEFEVSGSDHTMHVRAEVPDDGSLPAFLYAPVNGTMVKKVREALNGKIWVRLVDDADGSVVFEGTSRHAGVEIMGLVDQLCRDMTTAPSNHLIMLSGGLVSTTTGRVVVCIMAALLLWVLVHACKTKRHYVQPGSVGAEYDSWTQDGVLEHFWGEHIHHGFYPDGKIGKVDFRSSKTDMNDRLLAWAGIVKGASPVPHARYGDTIHVLDVGCGIGGSSRYLAKYMGPHVSVQGVTLSPAQVARGAALNFAQDLHDKVTLRVANALDLPFPDDHFDLVWTMESGEHMPDKEKFFQEIHRVLRPGGAVVMATWCIRPVGGPREEPVSPEKPLTTHESSRLARVYKEWALPFFISIQRYAALAQELGMEHVRTADWTQYAAPTWPHSVLEGWYGLFWLLGRGPAVFYRTLRDVFAIWHMYRGYEEGTIVYGILTARKEHDSHYLRHRSPSKSPPRRKSRRRASTKNKPQQREESSSDDESEPRARRRRPTTPAPGN